jgi:hypothetical protein
MCLNTPRRSWNRNRCGKRSPGFCVWLLTERTS